MAGCLDNKHHIPDNLAFESGGAVFQGGICMDCGSLIKGRFLGNSWTKESKKTILVPDFNSPEGKQLSNRCTAAVIKASPEDIPSIMQRFHEDCESLPQKKEEIELLEGCDFSKFEKAGWTVRPL